MKRKKSAVPGEFSIRFCSAKRAKKPPGARFSGIFKRFQHLQTGSGLQSFAHFRRCAAHPGRADAKFVLPRSDLSPAQSGASTGAQTAIRRAQSAAPPKRARIRSRSTGTAPAFGAW